LAREASGDDFGKPNSVCFEAGAGESGHVVIAGNLRPMLRQYPARVGVDFAKGDSLETGPFEAK
jgi:hypothetical protein